MKSSETVPLATCKCDSDLDPLDSEFEKALETLRKSLYELFLVRKYDDNYERGEFQRRYSVRPLLCCACHLLARKAMFPTCTTSLVFL